MIYFGRKEDIMPTQTVEVDEAKQQLSDLVTIAAEGGEVIIVQDGKPLARLVPVAKVKKRVAGLNRGQIWTSEDFDEPLPDEFWMGQE
jgi:prevent-host-death family protein